MPFTELLINNGTTSLNKLVSLLFISLVYINLCFFSLAIYVIIIFTLSKRSWMAPAASQIQSLTLKQFQIVCNAINRVKNQKINGLVRLYTLQTFCPVGIKITNVFSFNVQSLDVTFRLIYM